MDLLGLSDSWGSRNAGSYVGCGVGFPRTGLLRRVKVESRKRRQKPKPDEARRHYGAEVCAVAKRRLARRELRQYPIPMRWWQNP